MFPILGGIGGGLAGIPLGPVGIIAGGALFSGAGEALAQKVSGEDVDLGAIGRETGLGAVSGGAGMGLTKLAGYGLRQAGKIPFRAVLGEGGASAGELGIKAGGTKSVKDQAFKADNKLQAQLDETLEPKEWGTVGGLKKMILSLGDDIKVRAPGEEGLSTKTPGKAKLNALQTSQRDMLKELEKLTVDGLSSLPDSAPVPLSTLNILKTMAQTGAERAKSYSPSDKIIPTSDANFYKSLAGKLRETTEQASEYPKSVNRMNELKADAGKISSNLDKKPGDLIAGERGVISNATTAIPAFLRTEAGRRAGTALGSGLTSAGRAVESSASQRFLGAPAAQVGVRDLLGGEAEASGGEGMGGDMLTAEMAAPKQGNQVDILTKLALMDVLAGKGKNSEKLLALSKVINPKPTAAEQGQISQLKSAEGLLNQLETGFEGARQAGQTGFAKGPFSGLTGKLSGGALNQEAALYDSLREGFTALIARSTGERGVLTEGDAKRALSLIPDLNDSPQLANNKLNQIREVFSNAQARLGNTGGDTGSIDSLLSLMQ